MPADEGPDHADRENRRHARPGPANEDRLLEWIAGARAADLPHLHSFTRGLDLDIEAATAALTLLHHNGRTEGVNARNS